VKKGWVRDLTKKENVEQQTEALIEPILTELDFELVDVEYIKEGSNWYLRVYIDKPGGIFVDDCEMVSRRYSEVLDEKDYIDGSYTFEVSSPGLGRPLKKEKDFKRNLDKEVEVKTYRVIEGEKEFIGFLREYDGNTITIEEDGVRKTFTLSDIALIRLAIRF
jgi:ribosome maturation factor RimP